MRKLTINQNIIDQTHSCEFDKKCLENEDYPICSVENMIDNQVLFVFKPSLNGCNYVFNFGESYLCGCPIRKEIYRRYQI